MLALGMIARAVCRGATGGERDGLPRERIYDLGLWTIIGGLFGSKILMVFTEDEYPIFFRSIFCVRAAFITADLSADFSRVAISDSIL